MSARKIVVYDTTLRDGAQGPAVSFSAADKERIARLLDRLGFDYVEGGFPGSNPKDEELFARLAAQPLYHARLAAFGATRRANGRCEDDANLNALIESGSQVWTLVGKSDGWQVANVLQTTNNENLAMIEESVAYGVGLGHEVIFDAEHFFDGYARDAEYAIEACLSAARAGASWVVLCDTNGGSTPDAIRDGVEAMRKALAEAGSHARVGIHTHNDCELAVANTLAALDAGARQVECTINGIGERAGNAALEEVIMAMQVRSDRLPYDTGIRTQELYHSSQLLSEITGVSVQPNKAIVGRNAFAHEAGIHQHGVLSNPLCYEIMTPESVGAPENRIVLGKHSGRHALASRYQQLGYELSVDELDDIYHRFTELADKKKRIYDQDLIALLSQEQPSCGSGMTTSVSTQN